MINLNSEQALTRIPSGLLEQIKNVEYRYKNRAEHQCNGKIALFDLDNTLLVGDCGDALFAQLKIDELTKNKALTIQGEIIPFSWEEYQEVLKTKGKVEAYSRVIQCMAGLPLATLLDTTKRVMESDARYLELEGVKIPVPFPHPVMQALVVYLTSLDYAIYIISATNQYTVRYVAREYFGVHGANVFGMIPNVTVHQRYGTVIGDKIVGPVTVVDGKVEVYKDNIGTVTPIISGGDSRTDIAMLNLTESDGMIIWVGDNQSELDEIKNEITHPEILYFFDQKTGISTLP